MHVFYIFTQILLSLFEILNTFYDNILANIKAKIYQTE